MGTTAEAGRQALLDKLRETAELLERIASDRNVLAGVPDEEKARLLRAVELVNNPDSRTLRRQAKAAKRQKRMARINKADEKLHETGIRTLRRKPVFTTPNVFPPEGFTPADLHDDAAGAMPTFARRSASTSIRSTATSASRSTPSSITSTISCVPTAPSSTSASAPSWPTCAAASRC